MFYSLSNKQIASWTPTEFVFVVFIFWVLALFETKNLLISRWKVILIGTIKKSLRMGKLTVRSCRAFPRNFSKSLSLIDGRLTWHNSQSARRRVLSLEAWSTQLIHNWGFTYAFNLHESSEHSRRTKLGNWMRRQSWGKSSWLFKEESVAFKYWFYDDDNNPVGCLSHMRRFCWKYLNDDRERERWIRFRVNNRDLARRNAQVELRSMAKRTEWKA